MQSRNRARLIGVLVAACSVVAMLAATTGSASAAGTAVTTPSTNPFSVPGNAAGDPQPFTIVATGFEAGAQVSVEQCGGKDPNSASWSLLIDCDLGTSPTPAIASDTGVATFDGSKIFQPFKGESPQTQFNCLSPGQADPGNGLDSYGKTAADRCKVRVSTNNSAVTGDQVFFDIILPDVIPPTPKPTCDANGTAKLSKGVTPTPAPKAISLTAKGTLTNCVHFEGYPGAKYPISAGTFSLSITNQVPGVTCGHVITGPGAKYKTKITFAFKGLNSKGKLATATGSTSATLANVTEQPTPYGHTLISATIVNSKSLFNGKTVTLKTKYDETAAQQTTLCNTPKKGLQSLHFGNVTDKKVVYTPVNGVSTLELSS